MKTGFIIRPKASTVIPNLVTRNSLKSSFNLCTLVLCPLAATTLSRHVHSALRLRTPIPRLLAQTCRCFTHVIQSSLLILFPSELQLQFRKVMFSDVNKILFL